MVIIEEKTLSNGAVMVIVDESKSVAAGRWLVKLRCIVTIPWMSWMGDLLEKEDGEPNKIPAGLGPINYEMVKERNFIDQESKEAILSEMKLSILENIVCYLDRPDFTKKLFMKNLQDWRKKRGLESVLPKEVDNCQDEEPADFSACFR